LSAIASRAAARVLDAYPDWVSAHDTLSDRDRVAIEARVAVLAPRPVISLLLPWTEEGSGALRTTLASVQQQFYPDWQLCVATPPESDAALAELARFDARIRWIAAPVSGDVADVLNTLLREAAGEFVALLWPGDRLARQALYEIAVALHSEPSLDLMYSDEDLVDQAGRRFSPKFKVGWDPDLLLAADSVGDLAVWRRSVVDAAQGFRPGFGCMVGYDLALRAGSALLPTRIQHVPAVLYHRGADQALPLHERVLAADLGRRAVREHLGARAVVEPAPLWPSANRITWPLPDPPLVSIIVPTRDRAALLQQCVRSVLDRTDYPAIELLIVDNESREDGTLATLRELSRDPRVRILLQPGPFNFAALNNAAVAEARGEVVVLLNNDVMAIGAGWLREMVSHAVRPEIGAVGAKLLYGDGTIQHGGIVLGAGLSAAHLWRREDRLDPGYDGMLAVSRSLLAVTAACLAMRRAVYLEVGGLDAEHLGVAFNDVDLCLRLGDFGYRIVWTPFAELFHLESQSRGYTDTPEKHAREAREIGHVWRDWRHVFADDPFHNANLWCHWDAPLHPCPPRRERPWRHVA
jgi:GT2 family glycosyltransferase